jgi:hypothetical protein
VTGRWFSPVALVSSTTTTESHDVAELLLKVTLNTINQTKPSVIKPQERYKHIIVYF